MELLQRTASLPGVSGQWNSCSALPHCLGAVGSATPAMHGPTSRGQWAVQLLQCTAHCLGAVGSATPAILCLTARGQWAVELLLNTASLPGGSGQWSLSIESQTCMTTISLFRNNLPREGMQTATRTKSLDPPTRVFGLPSAPIAVCFRSSQPLVGLRFNRCREDEQLLSLIRRASGAKMLYIFDCRPKFNAVANTAISGGFVLAPAIRSSGALSFTPSQRPLWCTRHDAISVACSLHEPNPLRLSPIPFLPSAVKMSSMSALPHFYYIMQLCLSFVFQAINPVN